MKKSGTLLIVVNVDWYLISHRLGIVKGAIKAGWNVIVACEDTGRGNEINNTGAKFINFPISRSGTNPIKELFTIFKFIGLYNKIKPDVVHHISLKPVIYGSFAAKLLGVSGVLNAVSGLGYVFTDERNSRIQRVMLKIMKYSFKRNNLAFIFQNQDDYNELKKLGVIYQENQINFIKGSGVDLNYFKNTGIIDDHRIKVLLPSRMLWDKGVSELREASNILKENYRSKITFILAGMADEGNKAGVPAEYLKDWEDGTYVKWIGYQKDMVKVYDKSHIVVLPSYREGLPKSLIEACAMGKPIITTNGIGCKECVDDGINGYMVPVKSTKELAEAIAKLVDDKDLRQTMGEASRKKAEQEFNVDEVIIKHMEIYSLMYYDY